MRTLITPSEQGQQEIVIKKSRFIGWTGPVCSIEQAEFQLAQMRTLHKGATHHCFAYTVGLGVPVERFSDDGEPSGTAGRPILEVLRRQGLTNTLVIVIRYFGGTLLGASGLVRAYADAAHAVLEATPKLTCTMMHRVQICCSYSHVGKLTHALNQQSYTVLEKQFGTEVELEVLVPSEDIATLEPAVLDWCHGQATLSIRPAEYVGHLPDGTFRFNVWPQNP